MKSRRAAEAAQELHQPRLGVDVEVVGRFVEKEELFVGEEDARQLRPSPLAARECGDREIETVGREAEPRRDAPHLGLRRVSTRHAELVLGVGERLDVARRRVGVHSLVQLVEAMRGRVEPAAGQDVRERGAVEPRAAPRRILREVPERRRSSDDTAGWCRIACENLQERRLARAVTPDETNLVARVQRERGAARREPAPHFHTEITHLKHQVMLLPMRRLAVLLRSSRRMRREHGRTVLSHPGGKIRTWGSSTIN